ncbi:MAG: ABC transporter substrate-binding protein [Rhodospirillaceae bacterium]|jgi:NitT/TauT family transport system substrate-binding protein|nr:ABC transporter substrate-binding protein [Rhodospirillaceae bacterium]MBT6429728.1 ABC transporter substrate-binding protein [Rhodospirillaceae bacterium]
MTIDTRVFASALMATAMSAAIAVSTATSAGAATKIKVGRTASATIFELPTYVAMEKGFFKREGLDAVLVTLTGKALITAGIAGAIDFSPASRGGAQAALKGAKLHFVVGQSSQARWTISVSPFVVRGIDLKGKTVAFGRPNTPGFEEGKMALRRVLNFQVGRDYKLISIPRPADRISALEKGDVHGAVLSIGQAAKAGVSGFPNFLPSGQGASELNGAYWVRDSYLAKNRSQVAGFIRAITTAINYISLNPEGTADIIQKYLGIKKRAEANHYWWAIQNMYSPAIHKDLLAKLFDERRSRMVRKGLWPKNKPAPDVERFVARKLLTETLQEMRFYLSSAAKP